MKEKATAFIGGFIAAVVPNGQTILQMFGDFAYKAFTTAALGVVGGIAGLWAKEYIFPYLKKRYDESRNRSKE
ncbi:hypothetical protein [Chitinophaga sp.]|uniref:hypothetical protein n=1 Tax=Chitinophaga sp. TaxID=1869181 RepID=UPI0031DA1212